jgi:hypothetical protein
VAEGSSPIDEKVTASETPAEPVAKKPKKKWIKPAREQSTIAFPYMDLDVATSVAKSMIQAGGVELTREQLAGVMGQSVDSGSFITKIATARLFGLIAYVQGKYKLTDLGFAIVDGDERRQKVARAEAFLSVPLYRRTYDEFRGRQLPPRPQGLELAFVNFGVSTKQKTNARLAFDKSAKQAGFFAAGDDRLIEPIINRLVTNAVPLEAPEARTTQPQAPEVSGLHPFIQGLLDTLPEPETNWTVEGRAKWLQAAAHIFDLIYKGDGEIAITLKSKGELPPSE